MPLFGKDFHLAYVGMNEKINLKRSRKLELLLRDHTGPGPGPFPSLRPIRQRKNTKKRSLERGSAFGLWMGEGGESILEGNPESKLTSFERRKERKVWNRRTEPALTSPCKETLFFS